MLINNSLVYLVVTTFILLLCALILIGYAVWSRLRAVENQAPAHRAVELFHELANSTPKEVLETIPLQYFPLLLRMDEVMNIEDVKNVAYGLGIDYDNLPAVGKMAKIRELLRVVELRGKMHDLGIILREYKRYGGWDEFKHIIGEAVNGFTKGEHNGKH